MFAFTVLQKKHNVFSIIGQRYTKPPKGGFFNTQNGNH